MTKAQIDYMVDRFLGWKLPDDFYPDGGVSFVQPTYGVPSGTNLFTSTQADAMVRYMLEGMPG